MSGFESMSVQQMREELIEVHGYSPDDAARIVGKGPLAMALSQARALKPTVNVNDAEEFFNSMADGTNDDYTNVYSENDTKSESVVVAPTMGSPDWQQYVLDHLQKGEYFEKDGNRYPKCAGLRRVTQILLGDIIESGPTMVFPPDNNQVGSPGAPGRATVVYEVKIALREDYGLIALSNVQVPNEVRIFREAADAWIGNTPAPFSDHPIATASSRAEGRALKKALMLNIHTAEEMLSVNDKPSVVEQLIESDGEFKDSAPITGTQKTNITKLSKKLKIDHEKFITHYYLEKQLETLTTGEASELCRTLSNFQSKGKEHIDIPEDIKLVGDVQ